MNRNDIIGYLQLQDRIQRNGRPYWNCTCKLCNNTKEIREDSLKSGKTISCGCYKKTKEFSDKSKLNNPIEDLTGNTYFELTVLGLSEKRIGKKIMWTCLCSCGKIIDVWSANLKNGNSKSCGDFNTHRITYMKDIWSDCLDDLSGNRYGDWLVKHRDGNSQPTRWICECLNCGTIKSVLGHSLKNGQSTNCGCRKHNPSLTGMKVGRWNVGKRSKRKRPTGKFCTTYLCRCECGTERYVDEARLINGTSLGCGCIKSSANKYISKILTVNKYKFTSEFKFPDLKGPGNRFLRFDFAIQDDLGNVICLIEYQGAQHYIEQDFGRVQREITDPMKRKYCKKNNIPLYEIKYTDNIDAKLEKILTHIAC